jgi:hypothetical protein
VSATGLLTARAPKLGVQVIATTLFQGIRASDTAIVNVTAVNPIPTFQQLQLQRQPGEDSIVRNPSEMGGGVYRERRSNKTLVFGALDGGGTQIPNSLVALRISNPDFVKLAQAWTEIATGTEVQFYALNSGLPGVPFTVTASATVYGVTRVDTLHYFFDYPLGDMYFIRNTAAAGSTPVFALGQKPQLDISVGGWVWWFNETAPSDALLVDIVFDDPSAASADQRYGNFFVNGGVSGNIPPIPGVGVVTVFEFASAVSGIASRQFLQAGSYHWTSPLTGLSGTVVVH